MPPSKTYFPTKVFDDHLDGLAKMCKEKGWSFSGTDVKQLEKDATEQRSERAAFDKQERQYFGARQTFGETQQQRYDRYSAILQAARGAFKKDRSVMAELAKFKRPSNRKAKAKTETPAPAAPPKVG